MGAPPAEFPPVLWRRIGAWRQDPDQEDPSDLADEIIRWCDGRGTDDLEAVLDALREAAVYPISLEVLEAAWNVDLPLPLLGRVAEDWVGSVLHGLGDRAGAEVVAAHLVPRGQALGPAFAGDLGHLCLEWGLFQAADPLVRFASAALPGDTALRFAAGVIHKLAGEWSASQAAYQAVVAQRPEERAAWWGLGIACTALGDWAGARTAWQRVGFQLPPGAGDFGAPGEPIPVRLPTAAGAPAPYEVVWGRRLCPARVQLQGIPRFASLAGFEDVVLVDGVSTGEVRGPTGEAVAVLPALARLKAPLNRPRFVLRGPQRSPADRARLEQALLNLGQAGWPIADWTSLDGTSFLQAALVIPTGRDARQAATAVTAQLEGLSLAWPELAAAAGLDPSAHTRALHAAGLQ